MIIHIFRGLTTESDDHPNPQGTYNHKWWSSTYSGDLQLKVMIIQILRGLTCNHKWWSSTYSGHLQLKVMIIHILREITTISDDHPLHQRTYNCKFIHILSGTHNCKWWLSTNWNEMKWKQREKSILLVLLQNEKSWSKTKNLMQTSKKKRKN